MKNAPAARTTTLPEHYLSCLKSSALFSGLSDRDIAFFQGAAQARSFKKGEALYIQEEEAEFFYVICSGWVKLFHTTPEGEEIIVDMLTTGQVVGESSIFEKGCHTSSAVVIGDVQLISIPSHILKDQIRLNPALALSMLASMSRHHRQHYSEIALNAMQSTPQRIGCFLLKLCPLGKTKDIVLHLPYDKTLIAYILGMDGATFSRALNILRQKIGIRISKSRVEIDSVNHLMQFVHGAAVMKDEPEKVRAMPKPRDLHIAWSSNHNDYGLVKRAG
ncbi:MAG: Crp/Fnr family transcriptional regulator [Alphaproteobacteria bacterium]